MNHIGAMKQWAEGVSKAYELTAWGHTERAAEILRQTRDSIRTAIEAAEKQEPVAYSYTSRITGAQGFSHHPMPRFIDSESWDIKPLYTSPQPSKPWMGLTLEDKQHIIDNNFGGSRADCMDEAEKILREKNA